MNRSDTDRTLEPKPCPWCGTRPRMFDRDDDDGTGLPSVECYGPTCMVSPEVTSEDSLDDALKVWNNRKGEK